MPPNVRATLPSNAVAGQIPSGLGGSPFYWASVSDQRVASGSLSMPLYGAWTADVILATDAVLPPKVPVTIGNLTLVGSVYRQTTFAGRTEARLVAGAGGWSKTVQKRGYNNPVGVLASQVLADAAIEVGEVATITPDRTVGNYYVRFADKASRVLRTIASQQGEQWWIDASGVTRVSPRFGTVITSDFQIESFSGGVGRATIATEDPASWMPGNQFASATISPQTIASVRHVFSNDGVARLEVMTSANNDRWIEDIRQLVRDELAAAVAYGRIWEYQIVATTGSTIDALPVDPSAPVPALTGLSVNGALGSMGSLGPALSKIVVGFLDGNPGKPFILGNEGMFRSFVDVFLQQWIPVPNDGGAALKSALTVWLLSNVITP